MSVKIVNPQDAIQIIEKNQSATPATRNFFDVFDTSGCLLKCEKERLLDPKFQYDKTKEPEHSRRKRKEVSAALAAYHRESRGSLQDWFKAGEITASAARGCGSCNAFSRMFQSSFPGNEQGLSDRYEYSVSRKFELRRRPPPPAGPEDVESIQPFQAPCMFREQFRTKKS